MRVVYVTTCETDGCDWQPDPNARAGVETQCTRHMSETGHGCVITRGRPVEEKP